MVEQKLYRGIGSDEESKSPEEVAGAIERI